jgi:hypothetical protein
LAAMLARERYEFLDPQLSLHLFYYQKHISIVSKIS